ASPRRAPPRRRAIRVGHGVTERRQSHLGRRGIPAAGDRRAHPRGLPVHRARIGSPRAAVEGVRTMECSPFRLLTVGTSDAAGGRPRKQDGWRAVTTELRRAPAQRNGWGGKTVAELSRGLDLAPSVIRSWKRFAEAGATTAVQASEDVVPASQLREAYAKIREL